MRRFPDIPAHTYPHEICSVFHCVFTPLCLCSTMSMFHHVYVPQCVCSIVSMFHSAFTPPRLCSGTDGMVLCSTMSSPSCLFSTTGGLYVSLHLCSTAGGFYVPLCLWSITGGLYVPLHLCSTAGGFHVPLCLWSTTRGPVSYTHLTLPTKLSV